MSYTQTQISYPIQVRENNTVIVKLTKVQADELKLKLKTLNKTAESLKAENKNLHKQIDSLICLLDTLKQYKNSVDTVSKFKQNIYNICSNKNAIPSGVIIYRKNQADTNLYMIDLSEYNMIAKTVYNYFPYRSREKIVLLPVLKNRRWIPNVPQPQNLGLHLFPNDGIGDNNKKLVW